jgi:hypothetical protein
VNFTLNEKDTDETALTTSPFLHAVGTI